MKKMVPIIFLALSTLLFYSCSKEVISISDNFKALNPSQTDTGAKDWKTVLLSTPNEFSIDPPAAVTSPDYSAEINEIIGLAG